MADYDTRLVDLYDEANPDGPDHDYYRALADEIQARTILDLGCGTGLLTVSFARPGRRVVGVDPSPNMLAYARNRPGATAVRWVLGDSRDLADQNVDLANVDLAVMTGNVAQHILEPDWSRTLTDLAAALRPGGVLAFESRNPRARAWEAWADEAPTVRPTVHGLVREWLEVRETEPGQVLLTEHNVFEQTGDVVDARLTLAFRDRDVIEAQLGAAGFAVSGVWSDWRRTPAADGSPVMVFEARRA